jgi:hypothetical protein
VAASLGELVVLATRHAMPAIYEWRDFAAAGGLMSYVRRVLDCNRISDGGSGLAFAARRLC